VLTRLTVQPPEPERTRYPSAMDYVADNIAPEVFFGEGPRWHDGELWFSDFFAQQIKVLAPEDTKWRVGHDFPGRPSGLGWLPDGTMVASSMLDRTIKAFRNGIWGLYADISGIATFHTNDLIVNNNGDIYIGNFGFDLDAGATPVPASLALVKPDGSVTAVADDLMFPNGMVITPDGSTLVVAESSAARLTAFTIQADGSLTDRRLWAEVPGAPDGICLDAEGCIWVACAATPRCVRIAEGGEIKDTVTTEQNTYACILGGDTGTDLYIMTAPEHHADKARLTPGGWVARATVAVPRAGLP
jgi:sugar lactone lactonase YvrE